MSDEQQTTPATGQPLPEVQAPSAGTQNTDAQAAEHMVPKSRFDEVNSELKRLKTLVTEAEKAKTQAEQDKLKEQGEYKALYESLGAKLATAEQKARAAELTNLRREAAEQVAGFPVGLAGRIQGETLDEMITDAKQILAALPKAVTPTVSGVPSTPKPTGNMDSAQLEAARRQNAAAFYRDF